MAPPRAQLADTWTLTCEASEYAEFLSGLLERIATTRDGMSYLWKPDELIRHDPAFDPPDDGESSPEGATLMSPSPHHRMTPQQRALTPAHSAGRRRGFAASGRHWQRIEASELSDEWFVDKPELRHAALGAALVAKTEDAPDDASGALPLEPRAWKPSCYANFSRAEWAKVGVHDGSLSYQHYVRVGDAVFVPAAALEGEAPSAAQTPMSLDFRSPARLPRTPSSSMSHSTRKPSTPSQLASAAKGLFAKLRSPHSNPHSRDSQSRRGKYAASGEDEQPTAWPVPPRSRPSRRMRVVTPTRLSRKAKPPTTKAGPLVTTAEFMITNGDQPDEPPGGFVKGGASVVNFAPQVQVPLPHATGLDQSLYSRAPGPNLLCGVARDGASSAASSAAAASAPSSATSSPLTRTSTSSSSSVSAPSEAWSVQGGTSASGLLTGGLVAPRPVAFSEFVARRRHEVPPAPVAAPPERPSLVVPATARPASLSLTLPPQGSSSARPSMAVPKEPVQLRPKASSFGESLARRLQPVSPRNLMSRSPGGRAFFSARRPETTEATLAAAESVMTSCGGGGSSTARSVTLKPLAAPRGKRSGAELTRRLAASVAG